MSRIIVSLSERSYAIDFVDADLARIRACFESLDSVSGAVVLTDENVNGHGYARTVADALSEGGFDVSLFTVAAGEASKSIETAATLWETLLEDGADRKSVLVSVGGGVIGDLGGFVAATYMRGIRFFQVPTTLLAQVDSSVGGKVGIDLPGAKNSVGAFHQPVGGLDDTSTLATLPEEEYLCGIGEVAKYAVSLDAELFALLERNAPAVRAREKNLLREIIAKCCAIKANIVAQDEHETKGLRILLNYGHTFAHAFEILSEYRLLHGQAVAIGSICAARLAVALGRVDAAFLDRQIRFHESLGLPTSLAEHPEIDPARAVELMYRDKKTEQGRLRFVLPLEPGRCETVVGIEPDLVCKSIM